MIFIIRHSYKYNFSKWVEQIISSKKRSIIKYKSKIFLKFLGKRKLITKIYYNVIVIKFSTRQRYSNIEKYYYEL